MAINIKFTKFDNTPWGFRLAGGSDFPQPLTVIRVTEGSLAECMGLKVGDVVVRLNDQPVCGLTHGQAHEELVRAGNNFVLAIQRGEDSLKAVEALSEENIVPYKIPLAELPPVFPEEILKEETVIEQFEEEIYQEKQSAEEEAKPEVEPLPDKPKDANSEIVPNQNLTDDEIAQLILEEEELLSDKGVLGVNFKKLKPRAPILKESKVLEELQNIATADPPLVEELKRTSVFLQKPQRPVPLPRKKEEPQEETEVETYRVVIKKQQRRSITDRLLDKGLLKPEDAKTPEPPTAEVMMDSNELEAKIEEDDSPREPEIDSSKILADCIPSERESDGTVPRAESPSLESPDEICFAITEILSPVDEQLSSPSNETLPPDNEICSENSPPFSSTSTDISPLDPDTKVEHVATLVPPHSPKRKDNVSSPRRAPSKHKVKRFYTRAHYFRRCFFGKRGHGEGAKKTVGAKPPSKEVASETEKLEESRLDRKEWNQIHQEGQRRDSVDGRSRSRTKGRYLETYLKREDVWLRRASKGLLELPADFCANKLLAGLTSDREVSLRRTRYAEKIVSRSFAFLVAYLRKEILGYFRGRRSSGAELESQTRGRRLYFKGRYFRQILWNSIVRLMNRARGDTFLEDVPEKGRRRSSGMIRIKGHYMERCLTSQGLRVPPALLDFFENLLFHLNNLRNGLLGHPTVVSSKRRFSIRTRYAERIVAQRFESLGSIVTCLRSQALDAIDDSSRVSDALESLEYDPTMDDASRRNDLNSNEPAVANILRSSKDFLSTEIFHRGSRRLSRSYKVATPVETSFLSNILRSFHFDPSWLSSKFARASTTAEKEKIAQDVDREGRRLSFVPTILYEGFTNRIGVDFTRLVAYAFVPCTSIVLLYMYNRDAVHV